MQSAEQTIAGAVGARTVTDQLTVEVAIDSDRFSQSGPLGRRLAGLIADACRGEAFNAAARETLELPQPFSVNVETAIVDMVEEPQILPPEQIKASDPYCQYAGAFAWGKGCSSWPW
jgi:hypothetical protein